MSQPKAKRTSQGPIAMWHCMDIPGVLKLLSMRPPIHWSRWHRWALLPPFALYNSVMGGVERLLYDRKVAETEINPSPLFIIGHWRSGTTLLHNLVSLDEQFTFPNMYHVAFPHHFLLTEEIVSTFTGWMLPKSRPMDNIETGWQLPQEDEIGLCALCLISPYLMITFPEKDIYRDLFELKNVSPKVLQEWKDTFTHFLKKVTYRDPKPIVLKSPSHTYRIPLLLDMFPDAKFLYIYRNPYHVFRSSMHLRRALFEENTLGLMDETPWESEILEDYGKAIDCYENDRHMIPEGNLHEIRFEDLELDPLTQIQQAYEGLSLPGFEVLKQKLIPEIKRLEGYKKNAFSNLEMGLKRRIYEQGRVMFERYGYDPEGAEVACETSRLAVPA
ncbi:MAG: sulfotransferase [Planctomycetaceae bacterium]|nr:sulfotransferase [Planctomycetaceae bacterium]